MKTLGLIGGLSWESTQIYYQLLNRAVREELGGLHSAKLLMVSFDFAEVEALQAAGDWDGAADMMRNAAHTLRRAGAEAILICSNTMHRMAADVEAAARLPLVHIADATGEALVAAGIRRPLLLATRYTMEQDFYRGRLAGNYGLDVVVPDEDGRTVVHDIIYDELCRGVVRDVSRTMYVDIVDAAVADGADAVIFGCTEIGMLLAQRDVPVQAFDTAQLHCAAAVRFMLGRPAPGTPHG